MWNVPHIPNYAQERYDELTSALALAELGRQRAEQERRQAEQDRRNAIALLLTTRFPGINGEQAMLERALETVPFEQATLRAATWSLADLLRFAQEETH